MFPYHRNAVLSFSSALNNSSLFYVALVFIKNSKEPMSVIMQQNQNSIENLNIVLYLKCKS